MTFASDRVTAPSRQATPSRRGLFAGVAAGNFLVLLDTSILNVALPDVRSDLHASQAALPWAVDAYTIVFAGLLLASGAVADRFGARSVYRGAVLAFGVLSLLCATSPDAAFLIGGRALLGVAAAGMVPASLALLAGLYPDPAERARAIGAWAAVTSTGLIAGPVLGGALVELGGWRLVFLVNPVIVVVALLASRGLPGGRPDSVRAVDRAGIGLSVLALAALTFGLIDAGTEGWGQPLPLLALALAAAAFAALFVVERRATSPILPPALVGLARVRADIVAGAMASFIFYGVLYALTQWMVEERGLSAFETGTAFLPMTLPMCFMPLLTGRLVARIGARRVILVGLALDTAAGGVLAFASNDTPLALVITAQVALSFGSTLAIPAATADMALAAPKELAATGQGAFNAGRQAGSALGVAALAPLATLSSSGIVLAAGGLIALLLVVAARPAPAAA
ncbi:MFS transporter [Streptomyces gibsoniae]|uniref:MFS transporter n=1 Tax=Streptomyces gibsoniae TaxID=3075529 RepID=A0ABU2TVM9_9ACTN|nr:MFS transporter [Streptomyces sp. DSM 41699]MDT0465019.1 MFS transporter [Streptomyces sp. DSM 41699]